MTRWSTPDRERSEQGHHATSWRPLLARHVVHDHIVEAHRAPRGEQAYGPWNRHGRLPDLNVGEETLVVHDGPVAFTPDRQDNLTGRRALEPWPSQHFPPHAVDPFAKNDFAEPPRDRAADAHITIVPRVDVLVNEPAPIAGSRPLEVDASGDPVDARGRRVQGYRGRRRLNRRAAHVSLLDRPRAAVLREPRAAFRAETVVDTA